MDEVPHHVDALRNELSVLGNAELALQLPHELINICASSAGRRSARGWQGGRAAPFNCKIVRAARVRTAGRCGALQPRIAEPAALHRQIELPAAHRDARTPHAPPGPAQCTRAVPHACFRCPPSRKRETGTASCQSRQWEERGLCGSASPSLPLSLISLSLALAVSIWGEGGLAARSAARARPPFSRLRLASTPLVTCHPACVLMTDLLIWSLRKSSAQREY